MKFEIKDVNIEPCIDSRYVKPKRVHYIQNGKEKIWDVVETHSSVSLLIYEIDTEKFVLVKQFRPAVFLNNQDGITYELCAGLIDKDKSLEEIAKEEAFEECGYDIPLESIKKVTSYYTSVGFSGGKQHLFMAEIESSCRVGKGGGIEDEEIEVVYLHKSNVQEFLFDEDYAKSPGLLFALTWYLNSGNIGTRLEKVLLEHSKSSSLGELLGVVAHQWKQPLSTISLLAGQLLHRQILGTLDNERLNAISNGISDNVKSVNEAIESFMSFYDDDNKKREFNLKNVTAEMIKILKPQLDMRAIEIEMKIKEDGSFIVSGYQKLFKQAIINLLINSRDAVIERAKTEAEGYIGKIDVILSDMGDGVELQLRDNGIGLTSDIIKRLFKPFVTTKQSGSGTGLYVSKIIIEDMMGGTISASMASNPTIFKIFLPR